MGDIPAAITHALSSRDDIVFAYLFGSQASQRTHPRSDIDVAVWLREPYPRDSFAPITSIQGALNTTLKRDDIDVVILNEAPLSLAFAAVHGKLLLSRDEEARIQTEAAIKSRYHDRLPYVRRHIDREARRMAERGFS